MMSDSTSQETTNARSTRAPARTGTLQTDYPTVPAAMTDVAPEGKGTAKFLGKGLIVFPLVVLLGVIFVAVIVIFAQTS